jgi:ADP-ribose pyrophosphatase
VFEGRIFSVETVDARLPNGKHNDYHLVVHHEAVTLVPVDQEGNIWFVRQYRLGAGDVILELPAGILNGGELPEPAALREIREEIGMAAGRLQLLGQFYMSPGYTTEYMYAYLAQDLTEAPLNADDDEFIHVEKIPLERAFQMARSGEIKDGKTLVALLLAQPLLTTYRG